MMTHRFSASSLPALLSLLVAAAPGAAAGTADDPEITDATFDAGAGNAWADIVRGWFETTPEGQLRATLTVGLLPEPHPGVAYGVVFDAGGHAWYLALVAQDAIHFWYGPWDRAANAPTGSPADGAGSYAPGLDAAIVLEMPLSTLGTGATSLTAIAAHVIDFKPDLAGQPVLFLDSAEARRDFPLPPTAAPEGVAETPGPSPEAAPDDAAPGAAAPAAAAEDAQAADERVPAPPLVLALLAVLVPAFARRRAR